ncbi:MAG: hypothetical protein J6B88_02045 [Clostridia bacterium]|nr:hypothetical protein [Clostridia bacterium]
MKKQGAMRRAPSEQGDYVFEGNARSAAAKRSSSKAFLLYVFCFLI